MLKIFYIGLGGFLGAVSRFLITKFFSNYFHQFPAGTLAVNVIGSFILGFVMYNSGVEKSFSPEFRNFITIGFIGAFTTMSAFAYESLRLAELSEYFYFGMNLFLNIVLCLLAVYLGRELGLLVWR